MEQTATLEAPTTTDKSNIVVETKNLDFFYGNSQALYDISIGFKRNKVSALIGPSGCGKSTFLRCLNRMNDLIDIARVKGEIIIEGQQINTDQTDIISLRRNVGMVFQKSTPFPKSIFENVVYGLRIGGEKNKDVLESTAERCLQHAGLWNEVKDRLNESALGMSGGQMQRLCIARAIAINPSVVLMDEPCSALDPRSTARIEDLITELASKYTIILVTHNMHQAARVSDETAFFYEGVVVEFGDTKTLFTNPSHKQTQDYITGRFG